MRITVVCTHTETDGAKYIGFAKSPLHCAQKDQPSCRFPTARASEREKRAISMMGSLVRGQQQQPQTCHVAKRSTPSSNTEPATRQEQGQDRHLRTSPPPTKATTYQVAHESAAVCAVAAEPPPRHPVPHLGCADALGLRSGFLTNCRAMCCTLR